MTTHTLYEQVAKLMRLVKDYGLQCRFDEEIGVPSNDSQATQFTLRAVEAFARAALERPAVEWLPIETAPKDGTPVDIWRPSWGGERCTNMRRTDLGSGNIFYEPISDGPSCVRDATHWAPIPPAPKETP